MARRMETMDVESFGGVQSGIENIALLKLFYDAGVDVSGFPTWNSNPYYSVDPSFDIFINGLAELYSTEVLTTPFDNKEMKQLNLPYEPEHFLCIQDAWLVDLIQHYKANVEQIIKDMFVKADFEADLLVLPNKRGLGLSIDGMYGYFIIAEQLIKVIDILNQLRKEGYK